jgi:uncharacterized RDD family membrane protein YckC
MSSVPLTDRAEADSLDPALVPGRYLDVRRRRLLAFCFDFAIVSAISLAVWGMVLVLGVLTFGLAWMLLGSVFPAVAIIYNGLTLSGPHRGTIGMRAAGLEMRMWYGETVPFIVAAAHIIFFYVSISFLTPLVLAVALFDTRKRLLHDIVLGTVVVNRAPRLSYAPTAV